MTTIATLTNRHRIVLASIGVLLLLVAVRLLPIADWLKSFQSYVTAAGPSGSIIFVLVYALACLVPSPAPTILTGLAGATFGLARGTLLVLVGATVGAVTAFTLARTVLRRRGERSTSSNPRFAALDRAIAREGGKIVFLTRLSPIFPFTYINYAFGLTGVRFVPYTIATFFGIVPGTMAFVYIGFAAATAAAGETSRLKLALQIAGAIATLAVSIFVARLAKKEIEKSERDPAPPADRDEPEI